MNLDNPLWYEEAVNRAVSLKGIAALDKALHWVRICQLEPPVAFLHENSCELKWGSAAAYLFPEHKKQAFLCLDNGERYVPASFAQFFAHLERCKEIEQARCESKMRMYDDRDSSEKE